MRTTVAVVATAVLLALPVVANPGHYEEYFYIGGAAGYSSCFPDPGFGILGVVCFTVMPGETNAALRIRDAWLMNPIGAHTWFLDITFNPIMSGPTFCGETTFTVPPGIAYIEVDIRAFQPPSTPCASKVPTAGKVIGTFW